MRKKAPTGKDKGTISGKQGKLDPKDREIARLQELVAKYEKRLEIDKFYVTTFKDGHRERKEHIPSEKEKATWPDGITCRDATIKLLESEIDSLSDKSNRQDEVAKASIKLIFKAMSTTLNWDRNGLQCPIYRELFDALEKAGYFSDEPSEDTDCQEDCPSPHQCKPQSQPE